MPQSNGEPSKGELTRQAILDAAIHRFGREGFRATSVADIARDAGVSGTAAYAYFDSKEALFLAACDEDAAALIHEGLDTVRTNTTIDDWREVLIFTLVGAVDHHPLARRLLAGQEPDVTDRVLELPALADLRKHVTERLRTEQAEGTIRPDIDADAIGNGIIAIMLSVLMSVTQLGPATLVAYREDVVAFFKAALLPPEQLRS
jgi:AcrR family transcriptional regulator